MEARSRAVRVFAGEGLIWLCQSLCSFYLYNMVKIQPFYQVFHRRNPWLGHFADYSFGTSKKKASIIFYDTAFF